nr:PREDICTED: LOW QUALITY PROTEIN: venom allergen 3-like [Linepithema humile]
MAWMYNILCLAIIAITSANAATNYCDLRSCTQRGSIQTMCKYPSPNPSSACVNVNDRGLTENEKSTVNRHNELRQYVASGNERRGSNGPQPPAAYMPNLTWDDELATVAQRWVDQCLIQHDQCRNVPRFVVGQNLAVTMNSAENNTPVEDMISMWYDEVAQFDSNQVKRFTDGNGVGHYTQLVWAETTKIGCGCIKFRRDGWNNNLFICNYGPAGNVIGQSIYKIRE